MNWRGRKDNFGIFASLLFLIIVSAATMLSILFTTSSSSIEVLPERDPRDFELPEKKELNSTNENSTFSGIFVANVYRITDDIIRLIYLQHRDNMRTMESKIGDAWIPVQFMCFNKTCDDILFCDIATRIGRIQLPPDIGSIESIRISAKGSEEFFIVPVKDVRMRDNGTYPHQVAVCLQPIFFYTDWSLIVQFFESWLAQGATKFYFYTHTYSDQTKRVLDFYKSQLGEDLELIPWSDLPVRNRNRGEYGSDPNGHVFRHGASAFMQDCMLRARSNAKYVANFDLDDFPFASNGDIGQTLDELLANHTDAAQVVVDWKMSQQKLTWDSIEFPSDLSLSLDSVAIVKQESVRWDYRVSKKIFHRPERVVNFDMHTVYQNERVRGGKKRYTTVSVAGSNSLFSLHLRRFERHLRRKPQVKLETSFDYKPLKQLGRRMGQNFRKRLENSTLAGERMSPWAPQARETMRDLEQCRREGFGVRLTDKNKICQQSSAGCYGMLSAGLHFHTAPQSWTDIANSGNFNNYLE